MTKQAQLVNAIAAAQSGKGRAAWVVRSSYESASELKASAPMTYREAKAHARFITDAAGYAIVEKA